MKTAIKNNVDLSISVATSRLSKDWKVRNTSWAKFVAKCSEPKRTDETLSEFISMPKEKQNNIKDVGGFVGGDLVCNGRRTKSNVFSRQLVTLDADSIAPDIDLWDEFTSEYSCAALTYGTHKWSEKKPRLRLIIPLSRSISVEEWEAVSRKIAESLGMSNFDRTTFDAARLMYWPSVPQDIEYYFRLQDGPVLDPGTILALYDDWKDTSSWPRHAEEMSGALMINGRRPVDPTTKPGIIGTFCRAYDIKEAIGTFLHDIYTPTAQDDRYTYVNGSTYGGLLVYPDGYAFSNHSTDPANLHGHGCNAFDLVRIHRFGHLDDDAKPDTPANKVPSYVAMEKLCLNDPKVRKLMFDEKHASAVEDFDGVSFDQEDDQDDGTWVEELTFDRNKNVAKTANNIRLLLLHDPVLKKVRYNRFCKDDYSFAPEFNNEKGPKVEDESAGKIALYLEKTYNIAITPNKVFEYLKMTATERGYNPVHDFITAVEWDTNKRIESALIDYLGAEDTELNRAVTKIWFVAAVARAFEPGIKFDYVLTLPGLQGIGKSTFLRTIAGDWFSDSFSFADKDTRKVEAVSSGWIIEIGELNGLRRANDAEAAKAFLSKQIDMMRPAYGHKVEEFPRHSVFAATTNKEYFLPGEEGDRRWWVVPVSGNGQVDSWLERLKENVPQMWAEAYQLYKKGMPLYLEPKLEAEARRVQAQYETAAGDDLCGQIQAYLDTLLPADWETRNIVSRRAWLRDRDPLDQDGVVRRTKVCAAEIRNELPVRAIEKYSAQRINKILDHCPGWVLSDQRGNFGPEYGRQKKTYVRIEDDTPEDDL